MTTDAEEIEWRPALPAKRRARVARHMQRFAVAGSLFRSIRERLGLTQVEAALKLGTTQANVSKLEKRPTADLAQLGKLAADSPYRVVLVLRSEDEQEEDLEFSLT